MNAKLLRERGIIQRASRVWTQLSWLGKALAKDASACQMQTTWQLLEEYGVPDVPALLSTKPSMLSVDPATNLR